MKIDIIILAASKTPELIQMTQNAINSCINSAIENEFNIVVVETYNEKQVYGNCTTLYFIEPEFNYNKTMNFGAANTENEYILFANNDLIFESGWSEELISQMKKHKVSSGSPYCSISMPRYKNTVQFGYELRKQVAGWALMLSRKLHKKIGGFNESVNFWKSDDIYTEQLKQANERHILAVNAKVTHLDNGSKTLKTTSKETQKQLTHQQNEKYLKAKQKIQKQNKYKFSVIIASFLGHYSGAATNREQKFLRAIDSVLNQSFKDFEIIIVSDGCDKTVELYKKHYSKHRSITCIQINKQPLFSGEVRSAGITFAKGEYIIYLDTDDYYGKDHLKIISENIKDFNFVYFNDIFGQKIKDVQLKLGSSGTSSICHKRSLGVNWSGCNGYTHDFMFIKKLINKGNYSKLAVNSQYYICHSPNSDLNI